MTVTQDARKLSLTNGKVHYENAERVANTENKSMGTIKVVFNQPFLEGIVERGISEIYIHWKDAPKEEGWYHVNKGNHSIDFIAKANKNSTNPIDRYKCPKDIMAKNFEWHELLYVHESIFQAINEKLPLCLIFSIYQPEKDMPGLSLGVTYRKAASDDWNSALVAQADLGHEAAAPPPIADSLRDDAS